MKAPFSTLVCTRKQKNGPSSADQALSIASCNSRHALPSSADQALSIASCNSRHALSARAVHPATSPCPTLSASAEPIFKTESSNFGYAGFQEKFDTPPLKPTNTEPSFQKAQLTPYKTTYAFSRSPPGQGVMPTNLLPVIAPRMEPSYTHSH